MSDLSVFTCAMRKCLNEDVRETEEEGERARAREQDDNDVKMFPKRHCPALTKRN